MSARRGDESRFVAGTYIGYTGWIDNAKEETVKSTPVIVHAFKKKDGDSQQSGNCEEDKLSSGVHASAHVICRSNRTAAPQDRANDGKALP
jgi:hypothetical protein